MTSFSASRGLVPALLGAIGALHAAWLCGPMLWSAGAPFWTAPPGDIAVGLTGAEALLRDAWHWPVALTNHLKIAEQPVSIAYTDSLPLLVVALKALGVGPDTVPPLGIAIAVGQILQPVAAGWALRRAGVSHPAIVVIGALIVAWTPTWYFRLLAHHFPLTWHWLLLAALGLAFGWCRTKRISTADWWAAAVLCAASAGTHVYLAFEVLALCLTGALVLAAARKPGRAGVFAGSLVAATLLMAFAVGLLPGPAAGVAMKQYASPPGHFGFNLLAPFDLSYSPLGQPTWRIDATGGQYEGMAYLGLGVLALIAGVACLAAWQRFRRGRPGAGERQGPALRDLWPLGLCLLGLLAFATFPTLWIGGYRVASAPVPEALAFVFEQLRSAGRMIWPLIYALGILLVREVDSRLSPRRAIATLAGVLLIQTIDLAALRSKVATMLQEKSATPGEIAWLKAQGLLGGELRLRPGWFCLSEPDREVVRAIALETARAGGIVDQPPIARGGGADCPPSRIATGDSDGSTDVILRNSVALQDQMAAYSRRECRIAGALLVCGAKRSAALPMDQAFRALAPDLQAGIGRRLAFTRGAPATAWLYRGWSHPEPWGTWSEGDVATVLIPLPDDVAVRALVLEVTSYAGPAQGGQEITILVSERQQWHGTVAAGRTSTLRVTLTEPASGLLRLTFRIGRPQSPQQNGQSGDSRQLGLGLVAMTLD